VSDNGSGKGQEVDVVDNLTIETQLHADNSWVKGVTNRSI